MPRMRYSRLLPVALSALFFLSACAGTKMAWRTGDSTPDYSRSGSDAANAKGRPPLVVPPELREEVQVPMPDQVAIDVARGDVKMSPEEKKAIAGKSVSVDTRLYDASAATVFSLVVDSMTALNLPVQSVDSPSGTITTEWIRKSASGTNAYVSAAMNVFGGGPTATRYRFIVRVFRINPNKTELQVRTLGQVYIANHWHNQQLKRKMANELFSAMEERLGALQKNKKNQNSDADASLPTGNP